MNTLCLKSNIYGQALGRSLHPSCRLDWDLFPLLLSFDRLWQGHGQYSFSKEGLDLLEINPFRNSPPKHAVRSLHAVVVFSLVLLFLPFEGQYTVGQRYIQIFLVHSGKFSRYLKFFVAFTYINTRSKTAHSVFQTSK